MVFLDWELPDGNGGEVAQVVQSRSGGQPPIILASTAHDSDEMREKCRKAGMDGFLLKPLSAERVRRMLATVTARRNGEPVSEEDDAEDELGDSGNRLNLEAFQQYARARPSEAHEAAAVYCRAVDAETKTLEIAVNKDDVAAVRCGSPSASVAWRIARGKRTDGCRGPVFEKRRRFRNPVLPPNGQSCSVSAKN